MKRKEFKAKKLQLRALKREQYFASLKAGYKRTTINKAGYGFRGRGKVKDHLSKHLRPRITGVIKGANGQINS